MIPTRNLKENLVVLWTSTWEGIRNHGQAVFGIRSSPSFNKIRFEIHYLCKQELCSKSLVRVYTSICVLDKVIENWSHLCKPYNNQKEYGSVTPGCRKETSSAIRHKAGLETAAVVASELGGGELRGIWGDRLPFVGLSRGKRHLYIMTASQNLCVYLTSTKAPLGLLKIFQDSSLYYIN